jgi:hypothetical protein
MFRPTETSIRTTAMLGLLGEKYIRGLGLGDVEPAQFAVLGSNRMPPFLFQSPLGGRCNGFGGTFSMIV